MPISDGKNHLKRIAFQFGDRFFRFAINPENMEYARPHRSTAVKTKSRIVIEDFQSDVPSVTISGTTGFNPTGKSSDRGIKKIAEMKKFLADYGEMGGNGKMPAEDFYFYDFTNDESYVVAFSPDGVTYTQDVSSPLTHRYQIKFYILRKASQPADESIVDPEIGNRYPSVPGGVIGPQQNGDNPSSSRGPSSSDPRSDSVTPYDPSSGNSKIYNKDTSGTSKHRVINPQAPDPTSYAYGRTGLGYTIGYYQGGNG